MVKEYRFQKTANGPKLMVHFFTVESFEIISGTCESTLPVDLDCTSDSDQKNYTFGEEPYLQDNFTSVLFL